MHRKEHRQSVAERFSQEARRFIEWADGSACGDRLSAPLALRRVALLYTAALELPQPWSEGVSAQHDQEPVYLEARLNQVRLRAAAIPLQHYSEIFSPGVPPDSPVVGDLADDLTAIYRDVALGLDLHGRRQVDDALWQWGFGFQARWGQHASSAIRALHCYLSQEDPSGLSSNA
ncbi:MAG TPA: DUF5063 domain-containing protein [Albitalea sp.]|uniref:DUF5063 domain-containing protein n=1 Tax=Piscinibacter sp. TaxID=1903157 RepID=UPI002ED63DD8